jgi:ABC-type dipeptide/oligopeptide/nickel transport system permease subunit
MRRALRQRSFVIGGLIVLAVILVAVFAGHLAPHAFGTDKLGRDIASRLIVGARVSLIVALSVVAITLVVGVAAGMIAGYVGGLTDTLIMRGVDIVLAFPEVVLAILVAAVLGPGIPTVIIALSLVWWPGIARLTRALVQVQKQALYVDAAIVCATPPFIIMAEATLSFLGLGVQEPTPSWGGMIRDGLPALRSDPTLAIASSAVIGLAIIGFNLLGDGLRDTLDPRLHGR